MEESLCLQFSLIFKIKWRLSPPRRAHGLRRVREPVRATQTKGARLLTPGVCRLPFTQMAAKHPLTGRSAARRRIPPCSSSSSFSPGELYFQVSGVISAYSFCPPVVKRQSSGVCRLSGCADEMSSWAKSSAAARRQANPNGSAPQMRLFRRAAPYPSREERPEELKDALESYEELDQIQSYSANVKYESYKHQPVASTFPSPFSSFSSNASTIHTTPAKADSCTPADRRKALYQKFYRQVQEERKPADCVVLSVTNQCLDYPKSLSQCLQERGLSVEMLYLQAESGLTRALQDVRAEGSPLCILVEQTNIALSSCTVIIFSESLKIHRNMPKDQAMDFVAAEYSRGLVKERPKKDPSDLAAQASQLLDDFLEREKLERHTVPSETRPLLLLLAEGVHLYPEELETISEYVRCRQEHVQASNTEGQRGNMLPPGLGKPPPLLPTPPGPPQPMSSGGAGGSMMDHSSTSPSPLLPSPGSYPKTKPPPLLSLQRQSGPSLGPPASRGLLSSHSPYSGPLGPRGPLLHHGPPYHPGPRGPHGIRGPPILKASRPPLLASPGAPHSLPRPSSRH
ncbi:nuclear receptor coactivator 5 isoform X1 [Labrus bergylta]|uniref:nuclear receptor coactivator 5 isoform X1 n=1 Tax=Labrus bergylta TaxID=56723 RepID=UPI0010FB948C|nr:nuclear receptor coactivator 5-like isoform X1 [Labrus bergylta]